jgi:mRNA interferase RelE/StbE
MTCHIEFTSSAGRDFSKLNREMQQRITAKVDGLADHPRPRGAEKLEGRENRYRIRVGDYRVIYEIQDEVLVVLIVRIGHRRDVYRR